MDCVNPHETIIWKYFGTHGTKENNWCVTDSVFTEETKDRCIKREWNPDGTIPPWYCPEIDIGLVSSPFTMPIFWIGAAATHFHAHLNGGGYNGHYSISTAPYE